MIEIKKGTYHIFPHISVSIWLHLFVFLLFVVSAVILDRSAGEGFVRAKIILLISFPVFFLAMVLLLNVFFWNSVVTVDAEGMRQRRGLHVYVWRWDEVLDVRCRTERPLLFRSGQTAIFAPKFIIISPTHKKKLTIVMEKYARKVFFQTCPEGILKERCQALLDECNFVYL